MKETSPEHSDINELLAFQEGLLDEPARLTVQSRLALDPAEQERLRAFGDDLEFIRAATSESAIPFPDGMSIKRRAAKFSMRRTVARTLAAAAAGLLILVSFALLDKNAPIPDVQTQYTDSLDAVYLQAAVAQLEYEFELIRALNRRSLDAGGYLAGVDAAYTVSERGGATDLEADAAQVLRFAAEYWTDRDAALSASRYQDLERYFPDSVEVDRTSLDREVVRTPDTI